MIEQIQQADEGGEARPATKRKQAAIGDGDQMPSWRDVFLYFLTAIIGIAGTLAFAATVEERNAA